MALFFYINKNTVVVGVKAEILRTPYNEVVKTFKVDPMKVEYNTITGIIPKSKRSHMTHQIANILKRRQE